MRIYHGRATVEQIFSHKQFIENCYEYSIDLDPQGIRIVVMYSREAVSKKLYQILSSNSKELSLE